MQYKRFIPCIYLKDGICINNFNDMTPVHTNPYELAKEYEEMQADEVLIYDLSNTDAEHEKAINIIKTIAAKLEIPVIGAGNVHKMEDIKKLLYAGCHKAVLNYSKESNVALTKEVSSKFGKDKIIACINTTQDYLTNHTILKELVTDLVILNHHTVK